MNYYSLIVCCFISLFTLQDKQFVSFKDDEVKISAKGKHLTVVLPFQILEKYHIQTEKVESNNLIPTEIHFEGPEGYKILGFEFSKALREALILGGLKCEVLSNYLEVTLHLEKNITLSKALNIKGYLYYQACDDRQCFYPRTLDFNVNFKL
ncbi:hypothetical protein ACS386_04060 [Flavobacteriaceae bacterium LMO-SS05]